MNVKPLACAVDAETNTRVVAHTQREGENIFIDELDHYSNRQGVSATEHPISQGWHANVMNVGIAIPGLYGA